MNKPLPLLALFCALALPLQAAGPAPVFGGKTMSPQNAEQRLEFVAASPSDRTQPLIKSNCPPPGRLAVLISEAKPVSSGSIAVVPLYCATLDAQGAHLALLDQSKLQLSVSPGNPPQYKLNRSAVQGNVVSFQKATAGDFPGGAPTPVKPVNPHHRPHPTPRPGPHRPGTSHVPTIPLTAHEKNWLSLAEFEDYRRSRSALLRAKPAPKDRLARLAALYSRFRAKIHANFPPAFVGGYDAAVAETPARGAIAAYEKKLDALAQSAHYAPQDTALTSAEQAQLKKLPSASNASKTLLDDYLAEITADGTMVDSGESAEAVALRDAADVVVDRKNILYFHTTTAYRLKISPTPASSDWDATHDLSRYPSPQHNFQDATGLFGPADWSNYLKAIAAAPDSGAKDAVVKSYLQKLDGILLDPKKKFTQGYIQNTVFASLSPWQKKNLCNPPTTSAGATASTGSPAINNGANAAAGLSLTAGANPAVLTSQIAASKKAAKSPHGPAAAPMQAAPAPVTAPIPANIPLTIPKDSPLGLACLNDAGGGATGGTTDVNTGGTTSGNIDQNPATVGNSTSDNVGVGTANSSTPAKKDPNMVSHVITGIGGAMVGLLFGTFFGPVGVLMGAALGFGAGFGIDKYFNHS